jgi:hypothetical protein
LETGARRLTAPPIPRAESRWQAAAAVIVVALVQIKLPEDMSMGPSWVLPSAEIVLLIALLLANPVRLDRATRDATLLSYGLIALIALANAVTLSFLVTSLLSGSTTDGYTLILAALAIWLTNVVVFALIYWEVDRGGPHARSVGKDRSPDLLFPQVALPAMASSWRPCFADYLFVSFTMSTAFSPADTMPLRVRVKMLMLFQALLSLVTVALVAARAVNILA